MKTTTTLKALCLTAMTAAFPFHAMTAAAVEDSAATEPAVTAPAADTGTESAAETTTAETEASAIETTASEEEISAAYSDAEPSESEYAINLEPDENSTLCYNYSIICDEDGTLTIDGSYGDLTEDEMKELSSLYQQLDEIFGGIVPEGATEMTSDEYEAGIAAHQEEIDRIEQRIAELEEKAGMGPDLDDLTGFSGTLTISDASGNVKTYKFDDKDTEEAAVAKAKEALGILDDNGSVEGCAWSFQLLNPAEKEAENDTTVPEITGTSAEL